MKKNKTMKKERLLRRLLFSPFVFCIMFIHSTFLFLRAMYCYIRYGGEIDVYYEKGTPKKISDLYEMLKEQHKSVE